MLDYENTPKCQNSSSRVCPLGSNRVYPKKAKKSFLLQKVKGILSSSSRVNPSGKSAKTPYKAKIAL